MKIDLQIIAQVLHDHKIEICKEQTSHELMEVVEMSKNDHTTNSSSNYHRGYSSAMEFVMIKHRYLLSSIINKQRSKELDKKLEKLKNNE